MTQIIQRSFTSGEIAPAIQSRADIVKYSTGLNVCENFLVLPQGGVYSRPGYSFRGEQSDSSKKGRLIPFSFNTQQTYVLVFEELKLRVMKNGGFVLKPSILISGVTQANPAVITTAFVHTFVTGEKVTVTGVVGMTELNGNTYTITVLTTTTFELDGVDSTSFNPWISGGSVQSNGIFELVTPYTEAQLPRLAYTQSADIMTIVHPSHDPRDLSRLADDDWTLAVNNYASTVTAPTFAGSTVKTITNVTQANPPVVTATAHGFNTGNTVAIAAIVGMTELNGNSYKITILSANTFALNGEDSTSFGAYVSGGTATRENSATTIGSGFGTFSKTYTYVVTAVDGSGVESLASSPASVTTGSLSTTGGIRLTWNTVAGTSYYRVYKDPSNDTQIYGWIGDSNNLNFDDYNFLPITSDAPPEDRQPFTGGDNRPAAVNYYQQRQIFANTNNEPQATFTTQVANFKSLRTSNPARSDDAITFTIAAQQVNEIRHIISLDSLLLLTSGGEWVVSEGQDRVLTPSTIGVRIQSYNGSSWVKPVIINSTALYLQEKNARIRDLNYEFSSDKYTGNDLSLMSEHLFQNFEITEMAYADEPHGILWCIRNDGELLGLTYKREHQVWGWHRHTTDGDFESVATISEDGRDAVYVIVKRTINGSIKRYIERLEKRESKNSEDCFYVDSGLSYVGVTATITGATQADPVVITTSAAHTYINNDVIHLENIKGMTELNDFDYTIVNVTATTFELQNVDGTSFTAYTSGGLASKTATILSGLDHIEGKDVAVLADGNVVDGLKVLSGSVTLSKPAIKVHIGLIYTPAIELLDIDVASTTETFKSQSVSVSKVIIEVEASRGGFVGPRQDATSISSIIFHEIKPRFDSDGYDTIALKTYKQEVIIEPLWSKGGGVRIEQRSPLPLAILSVIPRVDIGGS